MTNENLYQEFEEFYSETHDLYSSEEEAMEEFIAMAEEQGLTETEGLEDSYNDVDSEDFEDLEDELYDEEDFEDEDFEDEEFEDEDEDYDFEDEEFEDEDEDEEFEFEDEDEDEDYEDDFEDDFEDEYDYELEDEDEYSDLDLTFEEFYSNTEDIYQGNIEDAYNDFLEISDELYAEESESMVDKVKSKLKSGKESFNNWVGDSKVKKAAVGGGVGAAAGLGLSALGTSFGKEAAERRILKAKVKAGEATAEEASRLKELISKRRKIMAGSTAAGAVVGAGAGTYGKEALEYGKGVYNKVKKKATTNVSKHPFVDKDTEGYEGGPNPEDKKESDLFADFYLDNIDLYGDDEIGIELAEEDFYSSEFDKKNAAKVGLAMGAFGAVAGGSMGALSGRINATIFSYLNGDKSKVKALLTKKDKGTITPEEEIILEKVQKAIKNRNKKFTKIGAIGGAALGGLSYGGLGVAAGGDGFFKGDKNNSVLDLDDIYVDSNYNFMDKVRGGFNQAKNWAGNQVSKGKAFATRQWDGAKKDPKKAAMWGAGIGAVAGLAGGALANRGTSQEYKMLQAKAKSGTATPAEMQRLGQLKTKRRTNLVAGTGIGAVAGGAGAYGAQKKWGDSNNSDFSLSTDDRNFSDMEDQFLVLDIIENK